MLPRDVPKKICVARYKCDTGGVLSFAWFAAPNAKNLPAKIDTKYGVFELDRIYCGSLASVRHRFFWRQVPTWVLFEAARKDTNFAAEIESYEMGDL